MSLLLDLQHLVTEPELRAMSAAEVVGVVVHLAIVTLKLCIAAALCRLHMHDGEEGSHRLVQGEEGSHRLLQGEEGSHRLADGEVGSHRPPLMEGA